MNRSMSSCALLVMILLGLSGAQAASAEEGGKPFILPEPTKTTPLKFTSTSGSVKIEDAGSILLECSSGTTQGEFTSKRSGTITMVFKGCAWKSLTCQNKGAEHGLITFSKAGAHLVTLSAERLGLVVTLPAPVSVECWLGAEFRGSFIGVVGVPKEMETKSATLEFNQAKGAQQVKECELDKEFCLAGGVHKKFSLEAFTGSKFVEMGVQRTDTMTLGSGASFVY
jgi:hypothetical protein